MTQKPKRLEDITGDGARVDHVSTVPAPDAPALLAEVMRDVPDDLTGLVGPEGMRVVWISGPAGCVVHLDRSDAPGGAIDFGRGLTVAHWPGSPASGQHAWKPYTPEPTPWHPGGRGILTEQDGVVTYEHVSEETGERLISWHCTLCHKPTGNGIYLNEDANVREPAVRDVARHLSEGHDPMPKEMRDAADAMAAEHGMHIPPDWCKSCRLVADLRASA